MKSSRDDFGAHAYIKKKGTYIQRTPPPMEKKKQEKKNRKKKEQLPTTGIELANFDLIV